jgi:hypothetical protein
LNVRAVLKALFLTEQCVLQALFVWRNLRRVRHILLDLF